MHHVFPVVLLIRINFTLGQKRNAKNGFVDHKIGQPFQGLSIFGGSLSPLPLSISNENIWLNHKI